MGRYTLAAGQRIEGVKGMAYGGMATKKGYAVGGFADNLVSSAANLIQAGAKSGDNTVAKSAQNLIDGKTSAGVPYNVQPFVGGSLPEPVQAGDGVGPKPPKSVYQGPQFNGGLPIDSALESEQLSRALGDLDTAKSEDNASKQSSAGCTCCTKS